MNVALLRKVQEAIKAAPIQFDMGAFYFERDDVPAGECGTMACICGWAVALDAQISITKAAKIPLWDDLEDNVQRGMAALDIDRRLAERLFFLPQWPHLYKQSYEVATDYGSIQDQANVACERIDHFIKTKN